jgi:hypothetical protein
MRRKWIAAFAFVALLGVAAVAAAHEGHAHKVFGTVTSIAGDKVEMKTPEGKMVTLTVNAKTTYTRGKQKVDATAMKIGERIVAEVPSEKMMVASSVTMAAVAVPR